MAGGMGHFDDSGSKPKQARGKGPSYNTYVRKRKGKMHKHAMGKAHGMRASHMDRVKGS